MSDTQQPVCAFIDDGLFINAYIKAVHNLYPDVRFEFRPILVEDRSEILDKWDRAKTGDNKARILGVETAKRIRKWSLVDRTGNPVEINAANVMRLQGRLFNRITEIVVFGMDGGDPDPDVKLFEERADFDELIEISATKNRSVHDVAVDAQVKN